MDINKKMTNGIFTVNDKHTQSKHELNTLQNHAIMDKTFSALESLINLSVSVTFS